MSSENTALWDNLGRTDPSQTQRFKRAGGFEGTAIKPIWSYYRMTEEFGPCGTGWGIGQPSFQVLAGAEDEKLVFCTVTVWYGPEKNQLVGVGGDKAVGKNKYGLASDDEAFKKSFTDAVTNALKMIGVGADVHMGLFDDSKYVNDMKEEFSNSLPEHLEPTKDGTGTKVKKGWNKDGERSSQGLKESGVWAEFQREILECSTVSMLSKLAFAWSTKAEADKWPAAWKASAKQEINNWRDRLLNGVPDDDKFPGDLPSNGKIISTLQAG